MARPGPGISWVPSITWPCWLARLVEVDVDGRPGTTGEAPVGLGQLVTRPGSSTHDAPDAIGVLQIARQRVDRSAPPQDRGVAQRGRELPGLRHRLDIPGRDEAGVASGTQGRKCPSGAQALDLVTVAKLHQLNGPLDIGEPAQPQLEVRLWICTTREALGLHPRLEHANLPYGVCGHSTVRPSDRVDQVTERRSE